MDVEALLRSCEGRQAGRSVGDPPQLFVAGAGAWTAAPPPTWDGGRYVGQGHGLTLILRGSGWLHLPAGRSAVSPGDALHLLPGVLHRGQVAHGAELWLAFAGPLAARLVDIGVLRRDRHLRPGLSPAILSSFAALLGALRAPVQPGDAPRLLTQALTWVSGVYTAADGAGDAWERRIAEACRCIAADPIHPPDLDRIAAGIGTTALVLRRRFRARLSCPPLAWWRQQRLLRAVELLPGRSIAEVARAVGYADATALSKQMRRQLGRPPSQLR